VGKGKLSSPAHEGQTAERPAMVPLAAAWSSYLNRKMGSVKADFPAFFVELYTEWSAVLSVDIRKGELKLVIVIL
jgi:hypothetical protein